jgi:CubicO group peptidase (beta-lactamase class C family)
MLSIGLAITISTVVSRGANAAKVDAIVRDEMAKRHIPGAQVAVVQNSKIIYLKSFGKATLQYDLPVKNSSLFTINSATKSFTGVALLQLVERGVLQLDDPVGKHLLDLPPSWQPVTIRQLATHVSGIPNIIDQSTGKLAGGLGEDEAWAKVRTLPMEFTPNSKFSYNQTNYLLLGMVIDKLSAVPFVQFMSQQQFVTAGLKHTLFADSRDVVRNLAQAYWLEGGENDKIIFRPTASEFPRFLWTGAGICSTAEDIAKWIITLNSKRILKAQSSLDALWSKSKMSDGTDASWAIGWPTSDRKEHRWVGGIGGGRSAFFVYPDDDLAVVVLTNLAGGSPEQWIDPIARVFVNGIP